MNNLEEELAKFRKRFSETEDTSGIYKIPTYQIWVHDEPYKIDRVNGKKVKDLYAYGSSQVRLKDIEQFLLDAISRTRKETIKSVVKKLSELPYHPEFEHYDGGKTERQVTYTTDIVHLENELKRLDQLDKGGKE